MLFFVPRCCRCRLGFFCDTVRGIADRRSGRCYDLRPFRKAAAGVGVAAFRKGAFASPLFWGPGGGGKRRLALFLFYEPAKARQRNVTIWARVQFSFGPKVVSVVP